MTELRRRGGGGEDPDNTDNISDKVKNINKKTNVTDKNLPGTSPNASLLRLATSAAEQVSPVAVLCGAVRCVGRRPGRSGRFGG